MDSAATLRDTLIEQLRQRAFGPGERMPTERALGERDSIAELGALGGLEAFLATGADHGPAFPIRR